MTTRTDGASVMDNYLADCLFLVSFLALIPTDRAEDTHVAGTLDQADRKASEGNLPDTSDHCLGDKPFAPVGQHTGQKPDRLQARTQWEVTEGEHCPGRLAVGLAVLGRSLARRLGSLAPPDDRVPRRPYERFLLPSYAPSIPSESP